MAKPTVRTYSRYSRDAARLLGLMIHNARIERELTVEELAERAGMSRGLVYRAEEGDMGCAIGAVFELAMLIIGENRMSNLAVCLKAAPKFRLEEPEAIDIITHQIETVRARWKNICHEVKLSEVDRNLLWERMFLNSFIFEGAPAAISRLAKTG